MLAIASMEAFAVLEKPGGDSIKEVRDREPRGLATSWYQAGAPGIIPLGGGEGHRESEWLLLSESAYFLCRTALARHVLQA